MYTDGIMVSREIAHPIVLLFFSTRHCHTAPCPPPAAVWLPLKPVEPPLRHLQSPTPCAPAPALTRPRIRWPAGCPPAPSRGSPSRISANVAPWAIWLTMTETGIRIPRMHARPPMICGSNVIRSNMLRASLAQTRRPGMPRISSRYSINDRSLTMPQILRDCAVPEMSNG